MTKPLELAPDDALDAFGIYAAAHPELPIYIGIDPGVEGAIGFLCGDRHVAVDIPVTKVPVTRSRKPKKGSPEAAAGQKTVTVHGSTKEYDYQACIRLFSGLRGMGPRVTVALEKAEVQLGGANAQRKNWSKEKGGGGNAYTGLKVGWGCGMWTLFLVGKGYTWDLVRPSIWKKCFGLTGKDKNAARAKAQRLFPRASLARVKDHGRAESLLLAEYARTNWGHGPQRPDTN